MQISFEFDTISGLKHQMKQFVSDLDSETGPKMSGAATAAIATILAEVPAILAEPQVKRGPGRPPKEKPPEVVVAAPSNIMSAEESVKRATMSVDDLEEAPAPKKANPTLDDVRADLQQVITGKSPDAARAILKQFGAEKISGLLPEQYLAVMETCHKVLKSK